MKQKILILGANGMLGHDLAEVFSSYKPILWDQEDLDITNQKAVEKKLNDLKPTVVINAAAYTNVDGAEEDKETAFKVNADAVGYIASACQNLGAILVQISTEYVFDGQNQDGYTEDSKTNPLNVYGQSKAKGEELLKENCEMYYLIRTCWLYGKAPQIGKPRGLNFVETMLKLAGEKDEIKVVNDQFGKPTYTRDLALGIKKIIEDQKPCGTYHVTNYSVCSWYDFAKEIFKLKNINIKLTAVDSNTCPIKGRVKALRPKYGILINTKLEPLRNWQEALKDYLKG